jgi:hypothetical protein
VPSPMYISSGPAADTAINVPASALIFDQSGLRAAVVGNDDKVVPTKAVTTSRDLGKEVEIASGLVAGDWVIASQPDGSCRAARFALPASWAYSR